MRMSGPYPAEHCRTLSASLPWLLSMLFTALLAGAQPARASLPAGWVNAADYGYTTADATDALQNAIDTGQNVYVPYLGTDWIIRPVFLRQNNQTIKFEKGVNVVAKRGSFHGTWDCLFIGQAQHDITLSGYGASLKMWKEDYIGPDYTFSEHRMAIRIDGSSNITIEGFHISDTGGDAVSLGSYGPGNPWNENVVIRDIVSENSYRQGISAVSVKNLLIDNCILYNTNGTPPASGIDFESDKTFERLENCVVRNTIMHGNEHHAAQVWPGEEILQDSSISFDHCTMVGNGWEGVYLRDKFPGFEFKNTIVADNQSRPGSIYPNHAINQHFSENGYAQAEYTAFHNNTIFPQQLGTGSFTGVEPKFVSTDPAHPYYMYLASDCPAAIRQGAQDGSGIGARPVAPPLSAHYTFNEVSPGQWEVYLSVAGEETTGLSAYSFWVDNVDPAGVNFEENGLFTLQQEGGNFFPVGFLPGTFVEGEVGGSYNAGNYQGSGQYALKYLGMTSLFEDGYSPGQTPLVDLEALALLGVLTTTPGLDEGDFRVGEVGLLDATGEGFLSETLQATIDVNALPWLAGDANCDGVVSADDYASVQAHFGEAGDPGILGDANLDGIVSADDYASVQAHFGEVFTETTPTPEPGTLGLLLVGAGLTLRRKTHTR